MKLYRLPFLDDISDRHGAGRLIRTHQIADKKVPAFKPIPMLIDHDTDVQSPMRPAPVLTRAFALRTASSAAIQPMPAAVTA